MARMVAPHWSCFLACEQRWIIRTKQTNATKAWPAFASRMVSMLERTIRVHSIVLETIREVPGLVSDTFQRDSII